MYRTKKPAFKEDFKHTLHLKKQASETAQLEDIQHHYDKERRQYRQSIHKQERELAHHLQQLQNERLLNELQGSHLDSDQFSDRYYDREKTIHKLAVEIDKILSPLHATSSYGELIQSIREVVVVEAAGTSHSFRQDGSSKTIKPIPKKAEPRLISKLPGQSVSVPMRARRVSGVAGLVSVNPNTTASGTNRGRRLSGVSGPVVGGPATVSKFRRPTMITEVDEEPEIRDDFVNKLKTELRRLTDVELAKYADMIINSPRAILNQPTDGTATLFERVQKRKLAAVEYLMKELPSYKHLFQTQEALHKSNSKVGKHSSTHVQAQKSKEENLARKRKSTAHHHFETKAEIEEYFQKLDSQEELEALKTMNPVNLRSLNRKHTQNSLNRRMTLADNLPQYGVRQKKLSQNWQNTLNIAVPPPKPQTQAIKTWENAVKKLSTK